MKALCLTGIMMFAAIGCTSQASDTDDAEGFTLIAHDATTIEASYQSGGATLHATFVERAPSVLDVTYDFGATVVAFKIDYNQGAGDFMPSGAPLDAAEARLIDAMLQQLAGMIPEIDAERTKVEDVAMRQTSFMQIVPVGEVLTAYHFVAERGWVHISCTCSSQFIGDGFTRQAGMGCGCTGGSGNGCKGRCGQGCGITSTPRCVGTTAYTQDCAKHDYGLGSFAAASDDFAFASNNCSCGGVGTCE
ncbi:MAG TPA: hypothetical protein VFP84_36690 [Kofleriaceae bacterium]|nr:hypothetical protein [Kofleriaceae bacterium]